MIQIDISTTMVVMRFLQTAASVLDRSLHRPFHRTIAMAILAVIAGALCGCGVSRPVLSVHPAGVNKTYRQTFTQAYAMRDAAGDYQVVLLSDPIDDVPDADAGKPLTAARVPPVRQVLQIRVLWRPPSGAKADSPAATNASLHWYVLGGPTAEGASLLHYAGTAFVAVARNGPGAEVTVRNGQLKVTEHHGELVDPLKSFTMSGRFDAVADAARVRQVLADVKSAASDARSAQAKASPND